MAEDLLSLLPHLLIVGFAVLTENLPECLDHVLPMLLLFILAIVHDQDVFYEAQALVIQLPEDVT